MAAEVLRILQAKLQFSPERKSILITSSAPAEGKTTIASNLAIVTAQAGAATVLLSGDLRSPELPKVFGVSREVGITEVLSGKLPLEREIRRWTDAAHGTSGTGSSLTKPSLGNLHILSTGRLPDNPTKLIASKEMETLLNEVKARFDVVLLDAPPLLPFVDSMLFARYVDGIVLVYEVGRIPRAALLRAKAQLEQVSGKLLGVVLNNTRHWTYLRFHDYSSYYRYYRKRDGDRKPEAQGAAKG